MKKRFWIIFLLLLSLIGICSQVSVAKQSQITEGYTFTDLRLHTTTSAAEGLKISWNTYQNRKIDKLFIEQINKDVIQKYQEAGYYLAKCDSFLVEPSGKQQGAIFHFYLSPGPQFILADLKVQFPDSMHAKYEQQIKFLTANRVGRPYTKNLQQSLFREIVGIFENNGYPLCRIETEGFQFDSVTAKNKIGFILQIQIVPGQKVRLNGLKLPLKAKEDLRYIQRVLNFKINEEYKEKRIARYQRILQRQDFIKTARPSEILLANDNRYYLKLNYEKAPSTIFDGIVGYIPPPINDPSQKGYFSGMFNIGLRNLFGTGRRLDVNWQKPDKYSENFQAKYREPFLVGLPLHLGGMFHRLIRDTTYIEWEYSLDGEIPLNESLSGLVRFYSREVFPDSLASLIQRLPQTRAIHTELGIQWDTRDDFYNPQRGLLFSLHYDYGTQRNVGPTYLLQQDSIPAKIRVTKVRGQLGIFVRIFPRQVFAYQVQGILIGHQGQMVRLPDMFWFGGATTMRGYRENQFYGEKVGWSNLEYRFLLGPLSRLFVFADLGYYERKLPVYRDEILTGYGVGISFPAPLGILQVDYGLAKGLSFSEGKIHFRLINDF